MGGNQHIISCHQVLQDAIAKERNCSIDCIRQTFATGWSHVCGESKSI